MAAVVVQLRRRSAGDRIGRHLPCGQSTAGHNETPSRECQGTFVLVYDKWLSRSDTLGSIVENLAFKVARNLNHCKRQTPALRPTMWLSSQAVLMRTQLMFFFSPLYTCPTSKRFDCITEGLAWR